MGARYLTDLGEVCRAAGLAVVEVDGWQTRARGSGGYDGDRPWAIMWHHTASQTVPENDVGYICHQSPDAPLANLYLSREGEVWICAAGATNTNGKGQAMIMSRGVVPVDQMNTHAIGIEAANSGLGERWPQVQIDAYFKLSNALAAAYGLQPGDCSSHAAYAPDRKIDPATAAAVEGPWQPDPANGSGTWNVDDIRDECWLRAAELPPIPPIQENDVELVEIAVTGRNARFLGYLIRPTTTAADGTRPREFILWAEWVDGFDPIQDARLQAYRNMGIPVYTVGDMTGIGLLGAVPSGDTLHTWTREDFGNLL